MYIEYINSIITSRGQWCEEVKQSNICERHHILPRSAGGLPKKTTWDKHENLIWLYPHEHFIAHKLLAEDNPNNLGYQQGYFILARYKDKYISPEEYEELRIKRLEILSSSEEHKQKSSINSKGRKWYNNGKKSIFVKDMPEGYMPGRSDHDKKIIAEKNLTRRNLKANKGKHWYNNGKEQIMSTECPTGWKRGTLPMSDEAKLAHQKAMKDNPKTIKPVNRGYETLAEVNKRISLNDFESDFYSGLTDEELGEKYNLTTRMVEKYRRFNKLYIKLRSESHE